MAAGLAVVWANFVAVAGGRWHCMASGWLGGNSGRCVCGGEAVCLLQTFSVAGMEVCVCVG